MGESLGPQLRTLRIDEPPGLDGLTKLLQVQVRQSLVELLVRKCWFLSAEDFGSVADCANLTRLTLEGCGNNHFSGAVLRSITHSLRALVVLQLTEIHLQPVQFDHGVADSLVNLQQLVLKNCHEYDDKLLVSLARKVPNLVHLDLGRNRVLDTRVTDVGVNALVSQCPGLRYLDVGCFTRLTGAAFVGAHQQLRIFVHPSLVANLANFGFHPV